MAGLWSLSVYLTSSPRNFHMTMLTNGNQDRLSRSLYNTINSVVGLGLSAIMNRVCDRYRQLYYLSMSVQVDKDTLT